MEKIVFLDRQTLRSSLRRPAFQHEWVDYDTTPPDAVVDRLKDATIAVTNKVPLREPQLSALPALKLVVVAATGYDCVDVAYCRGRKIAVSNVPNYTLESVPEHVFMMALALRRHLARYQRAVAEGRWQKSPTFAMYDYPIANLHGATLGVVGHGNLGKAVEALGKAFGMNILLAERKGAREQRPGRHRFEDTLRRSDVVTLHVPSTPATRDMFGAAEFALMKPTSILINTSRGGLVDENALARALRAGQIAGAGVDVLSQEPPPDDNPLLSNDVPNLILTPHIAWASDGSLAKLSEIVVSNMENFLAGKAVNLVG